MREIVLHTATLDNDGQRRQAGETVKVGDGKTAIDKDRAVSLVERGLAASGKAAAAPTEPSGD